MPDCCAAKKTLSARDRLVTCTVVIPSFLLVSVQVATAGPITMNTALPVAQGQGMVRGQALLVRGSAGTADQTLTAVAASAVVAFGLTRNLALFAELPLFVHKSLDLTTPMGRVSRESNGFGDVRFLARYTLLQRDHPGSTVRLAPFAGLQVPTGDGIAHPTSRVWTPTRGRTAASLMGYRSRGVLSSEALCQ